MSERQQNHCGVTMAMSAEVSRGGDQAIDFSRGQMLTAASIGVGKLCRRANGKTFPKTMFGADINRLEKPSICGVSA